MIKINIKKFLTILSILIVFGSIQALQNESVDEKSPVFDLGKFFQRTPLTELKLINLLKIKSKEEIINDIKKELSQPFRNDSIIGVYNNTLQYTPGRYWPLVRDSILRNESEKNKMDIGYYSIENGFFWYTPGSDLRLNELIAQIGYLNLRSEMDSLVVASNKLKACYWLWQIYTMDYDSSDAAHLVKTSNPGRAGINIFDCFSYPYFSETRIKATFRLYHDLDSMFAGKPKFFRIKDKLLDSLFDYHLNWIFKVEKYGLKKIRRKKISPLPDEYHWEKFQLMK